MKKKILSYLSIFVFVLLIIAGCTKNDIDKIELVEESFTSEYIVGENLNLNEFKVKATFKNKKENIYEVSSDIYTLSEIDNTLVGEQDLTITINYKNNNYIINTKIIFNLPNEVINVINLINELPANEAIDLTHEEQLIIADDSYNALSEFYKGYVSNYSELVARIESYQNYVASSISPYVINQRYIVISGLEKYVNSIDKSKYSTSCFESIISIYNEGVNSINASKDASEMNSIVDLTRSKIQAVKTLKVLAFEEAINNKKEELIKYKEELDLSLYSESAKLELNSILIEGLSKMDKVTTSEKLEEEYTSTINSLNSVLTLKEEEIIAFNELIASKVNEINSYYLTIDVTLYSYDNRSLINSKLSECITNIESSTSVSEMDSYITKFKKALNKILTIEEEEAIELENSKKNYITDIKQLYGSMSMYNYDSQNRLFIENTVEKAISDINEATTDVQAIAIRNTTFVTLSNVLTMKEQSYINLEIKLNNLNNDLDTYLSNLNKDNYSEDNYNLILDIVSNAKIKFSNEIGILTPNITITNMYNSVITSIDNVLTIQEENAILLSNTKSSAIERLDTYYKSLNEDDFDSVTYQNITSKINTSKKTINNLNTVEEIVKLVEDTIQAIELVK